jgi:hypothetical protein
VQIGLGKISSCAISQSDDRPLDKENETGINPTPFKLPYIKTKY